MLVDGDLAGGPSAEAFVVARWFGHTDLEVLVEAASGSRRHKALTPLLQTASTDLTRVCEVFVTLQGQRHEADYDHGYSIDRPAARSAVLGAEDALDRLSAMRSGSDPSYLLFLRLAGGAVKIARDR